MSDNHQESNKFVATIADGLRHAIRDHGPITKDLIGSAAKRIASRIRNTKHDPLRTTPPPTTTEDQVVDHDSGNEAKSSQPPTVVVPQDKMESVAHGETNAPEREPEDSYKEQQMRRALRTLATITTTGRAMRTYAKERLIDLYGNVERGRIDSLKKGARLPITQATATVSAPSTTVPDHGPASLPESSESSPAQAAHEAESSLRTWVCSHDRHEMCKANESPCKCPCHASKHLPAAEVALRLENESLRGLIREHDVNAMMGYVDQGHKDEFISKWEAAKKGDPVVTGLVAALITQRDEAEKKVAELIAGPAAE